MSRAALGHAGRDLTPAAATVVAYVLIALAGLARTFGPLIDDTLALEISGALWSASFALFIVVYAPICLRPRGDGRPG